jgi:hypothetical protein
VVAAISSNTRETDVLGWYEQDVTLGLLMTEIGQADAATIDTIIQMISLAVQRAVSSVVYHRLTLVFRVFPQEITELSNGDELVTLYPDISSKHGSKRRGRLLKRGMDIFGSLFALIVFFSAFLVIALLVKLTSKARFSLLKNGLASSDESSPFSNFVPCMPITTRRYTGNM